MSKRGPPLERRARDFYPTPERAALALVPHLPVGLKFYEPCCGEGHLVMALERHGMVTCAGGSDIGQGMGKPNTDAATLTEDFLGDTEMFITNPPWSVGMLHPIIDRLVPLRPTWLLLYSDWLFTRQAVPYHRWVRKIVTMPRVIWIPGTTKNGMDNCCWVHFEDGGSDFLVSGWG